MTAADLHDASHPTGSDTEHLRLRPGRPVLRRDAGTLQIGLESVVRVPDVAAAHTLLRDLGAVDEFGLLTGTVAPTTEDPRLRERLIAELARAGHLRSAAPGNGGAPSNRFERVTTAGTVGVICDPTYDPDPITQILATAGLQIDDTQPTAWLIVASGPLQRSQVDDLVRSGAAHLVVARHDDTRRVGPFVLPGVTACLRCVDAHESQDDPRRPLLIEQAARATRHHPAPTEPVQEHLALTWGARDLARFAAGDEPSTWSTTVDLPSLTAPHGVPQVRRWLRHPHCGCAWDRIGLGFW